MALFRRPHDPFAERERELKAQIAGLQGQIQQLHQRLETDQAQPKLRSTALPHPQAAPATPPHASEAGFEPFRQPAAVETAEPEVSPAHFNEQGLRKYDLFGALRRWWRRLGGGPAHSRRLANYLAAGSIEGLRPLRYEKRIARNRCLAVLLLVILIVWGTVWIYLRHR